MQCRQVVGLVPTYSQIVISWKSKRNITRSIGWGLRWLDRVFQELYQAGKDQDLVQTNFVRRTSTWLKHLTYLTYYCLLFHVDCIKKLKSNCVEDVKKDGLLWLTIAYFSKRKVLNTVQSVRHFWKMTPWDSPSVLRQRVFQYCVALWVEYFPLFRWKYGHY